MKRGIELGIRAQLHSVKRAAKLADSNLLDYFLVAETHPEIMGVNAFEALEECSKITKKVILGTGIINVFSREKSTVLDEATKMYKNTDKKFVLGLGTSAPVIVEQMYGLRFERPLSRILDYTEFLGKEFDGPIYWAAVGKKMVQKATEKANGILFFLKPRKQLADTIKKINDSNLKSQRQSDFQTISIIPTFIDLQDGQKLAKRTLAGYIGANKFYSRSLIGSEFEEDALTIKNVYEKFGLSEASKSVSNQLVAELTIIGSVDECVEKIKEYQKHTGVKTIVTGYDLAKNEFSASFFNKLEKFLSAWK